MTLTRGDPFGEMLPLRQLMDRLLEDAFIQPSLGFRTWQNCWSGGWRSGPVRHA